MPEPQIATIDVRRQFHAYPEPSWCEFYTTSRLVDYVESLGVDEVFVGDETLDVDERLGVPDESTLEHWYDNAAAMGARSDVLESTAGGNTGLVAVVERGPGPVVGLRVDIDALPFEEASDSSHTPAADDFRSENTGVMHACGHDGHMAIGLGVLETLMHEEFSGTLKVFFQPAEEVLGGGRAMAATRHTADLDAFFAVHLGLGHPTGEIVGGSDRPLALRQSRATFHGESAHAGFAPNEGRNAMQAMSTAIHNLYGIPRHEDDLTRVNVGRARAGAASNVVADSATIDLEVRAGTNDVLDYMLSHVDRMLEAAACMHDCSVSTTTIGRAPRVDSDGVLSELVADVASRHPGVSSVKRHAPFGASEDTTYFMRRVLENGGNATYVIVGTDHPSGHHTPRFDIDERSLEIGRVVLSDAIFRVLTGERAQDDDL
ncbi:amidohydrolase [Natrarchaeobius halalkaliphilus]|uniref:Amidohydrolase n=1 Tax=Natrarchaeobius halalkaliphilus TaxID=1679091 RepID=A0A3N6LM57_9EURY|nr:amidohydrolase [Natrarchaeobius halalkaliphilus]RQG90058.1 amidohydrolase [Natrarchaeobius halalkaliphilus]